MIAEQDVWSTEKSSSKVIDAKYFKHEGSQLKKFVCIGWAKEVHSTIQKHSDFDLEIGFDTRLLEKAQFCKNFITKGWCLLKKFIQGQQRPKRPIKAKKGHQRPEHQKIIDFINIQCKIINKWECNTKKNLFFKNWKLEIFIA